MASPWHEIHLPVGKGLAQARLSPAPGATAAALLVGGVGGGFDSPARDLYGRLAAELPKEGVACLRLRYRDPADLDLSIEDVLAGIARLGSEGVGRIGLVGHSFGGAVVIAAGARSPSVATVVTLATQSYGADEVTRLAPRPLLLVHGTEDTVLPAGCSSSLFTRAGRNAQLRLLEGAGHVLDEAAGEVHDLVHHWLLETLAPAGRPTAPAAR